MKTCFKCGEVKPLDEFYKNPGMADGHVNKCKDCNKKDVINNRAAKIDSYRAYDRERGNRLPPGHCAEYRKKFPQKAKAHALVNSAIKCGRLIRQPCEVCGKDKYIHAHHDDYSKPLEVRWLCAAHHRQWHVANAEKER